MAKTGVTSRVLIFSTRQPEPLPVFEVIDSQRCGRLHKYALGPGFARPSVVVERRAKLVPRGRSNEGENETMTLATTASIIRTHGADRGDKVAIHYGDENITFAELD